MAKKKKEEVLSFPAIDEDIQMVLDCYEDGTNNAMTFMKNAEKWHKLRMRIKKVKNDPFKGCSNIRMPTLETKIRKLKAQRINTVLGIRPVVQAIPTPTGDRKTAIKIEKLLDHLIMDVIKTRPKLVIGDDRSLEKGHACLKPIWDRQIHTRVETLKLEDVPLSQVLWFFKIERTQEELEKAVIRFTNADMNKLVEFDNMKEIRRIIDEIFSGKPEIEFILKDVIKNQPDFVVCPPERIIVPSTSGYDPQDCQWMIHEFYLPLETVKQNAKLKGWDKESVNLIITCKDVDLNPKNSNIEILKDQREGIERLQEKKVNLVKIHEWYGWCDLKGNGNFSNSIITMAPEFKLKFRKIANDFPTSRKPFVKLFYELTDNRWYSHRGIPELLEDIVKEIDVQHMQKIDSQTIRNSIMFAFRPEMVGTKTVQFQNAQGIPVHGFQKIDDVIKPMHLTNTNAEYSYKDEQMILESKASELVGQTDFTLQSMINKREPRTASEVGYHQAADQLLASLDITLFIDQVSELFNWIWELWCMYGDDEYEFLYFGNPDKKEGEKIKLTREEIQGKYVIKVRGNDQNTNPQIKIQKAEFINKSLQNEIPLKMGIVQPINIYNAMKRMYEAINVENIEELISTPPKPQPPPPPMPEVKIDFKDLTPMEKAQVLQRFGIQADGRGQQLKKEEEDIDKAHAKAVEMFDVITSGRSKNG